LIIGVRSAVFAPVPDLAAMVVVDEQEKAYKEERHPRFHARDVAVVRCHLVGCPLLMTASHPSAETWFNLGSGAYAGCPQLTFRYEPPASRVVDMRRHRGAVVSPALGVELGRANAEGRTAVLYLNRKGLSRHVACRDCGAVLGCPDCGVPLTLSTAGRVACRYCGSSAAAPESCQCCRGGEFSYGAPGIEMVRREVIRLLPGIEPITIDADSPLSQAAAGAVLIGTRSLLGAVWPGPVGVVAALSADDDLYRPDFRVREQAFGTLAALARRSAAVGARLIVQTRRPDEPVISAALSGDVPGFLNAELASRREHGFPPFRRLATIEFAGPGAAVATHAGRIARRLGRERGVDVLGPVFVPGRGPAHRLLVKIPRGRRLDRLVALSELNAPGVRARVDVDPLEVM
jgi:primosomal protein N' (replication factor Y)